MSFTHQAERAPGSDIVIHSVTESHVQNSGQYCVNQNNHDHYLSSSGTCAGINILLNATALNAPISDAPAYIPRCFPGTREQYIDDITNWATAPNDCHSFLIYRMKGPAGVGKSAIAQTCTELVKKQGKLGAAFFFSIAGCNDHRRFFTTIAYQLSTVLPEYKQILNDRILSDKRIIEKTIAYQFAGLIIEPLQELKDRGREVGMRTIFIDGVDECRSPDAQSQIIELIASSVRDRTTPFRWAFFSRPEVQIETTFALDIINPLCRTVELPISREVDEEIRLYLENGFRNILRRSNFSVALPWPSAEVIQKLVLSSAGLYAYPAAVLRFVDTLPTGDPEEALAAVLGATSQQNSHHSPFAELDAFYMLIMKRVPSHISPCIQLIFATTALMIRSHFNTAITLNIAPLFNSLQLSEEVSDGMRKYFHAVLCLQETTPALQLGADIDVNRPYYEQRNPSGDEAVMILSSLGSFKFYHKSFFDFLVNPARSAAFCVTTSDMQMELFERRLLTHLDLTKNCEAQEAGTTGLPAFKSAVLSLPLEHEYSSSYVRDYVLLNCPSFVTFSSWSGCFDRVPHQSLEKLSEMDYRTFLSVINFLTDRPQYPGTSYLEYVFGTPAETRIISGCQFCRLAPIDEDSFNFMAFLLGIKLFRKLGIIQPYHPSLTSRLKSLLQKKRSGSGRSGLFTLGLGDKALFWYWEFDTDLEEYYEFRTVDLTRAMEIFQSSKQEMWSPDWTPPLP